VTFDPDRRGGNRTPVLRDDWREPLRAQRDPLAWGGEGRARSNRDTSRFRKQSWLGRFVSTYGWRAYALPVLVAVTGVVLYQTVTGTSASAPVSDASLPTGMLPNGGPFTGAGAKSWQLVPGVTPQVGQGTAKVFKYTVEVENGMDPTAFGGDDAFAAMVDQTLANPKSWTHDAQFAFVRIDANGRNKPDIRISLSSPMTVRQGCGYEFPLETSCYNPSYGAGVEPRVFINEARWVRGALAFQGDVGSYRQYLINHEVGHAIGYLRHEPCDKQGALAPIMMQQTFSTSDDDNSKFDPEFVKPDGKTCRFNPWPYPIA